MRSLIRLCLQRPVAVTAVYVVFVGLALVALARMPITLLPDIDYPALTVWTSYAHGTPDEIEEAVTQPVESALASTQGLRHISSRSLPGGSLVALHFTWGTNLDLALLDVRQQLDRLLGVLPERADRPTVLAVSPSQRPIGIIAMRPDTVKAAHLVEAMVSTRRLSEDVVARRFEHLDGIARVRPVGGQHRIVSIRLHPERLAHYGLNVSHIRDALAQANQSVPVGTIREGPFRLTLEVTAAFESIDDIERLLVRTPQGLALPLNTLAAVGYDVEDRQGLARYDGHEVVLLLIERRPDANTVRAMQTVREELARLRRDYPEMRFDLVIDESGFVREAVQGLGWAVLLGGLLAMLVLYFFIRRRRILLAVAITIPLSLCITAVVFDWLEVSLNLISLSGLALGVGMLVDNAIVVVDNITRLSEEGAGPDEAALEGTAEVAGAIFTSTLTTIAVFLPITFVEGLGGYLFADQSVAIVSSLLSSLLVALTVVPLLARHSPASPVGNADPLAPVAVWYERLLGRILGRPGMVAGVGALLTLAGVLLIVALPREVVPQTQQPRLTVNVQMPPGTPLDSLAVAVAQVEHRVRQQASVVHVLSDVGEQGGALLEADPRPAYEADLTFITSEASALLHAIQRFPQDRYPRVRARPYRSDLERLLTSEEADLFVELRGADRVALDTTVALLVPRFRTEAVISRAEAAYGGTLPAYHLAFDFEALDRFGVSKRHVLTHLEAASSGLEATALRRIQQDLPIMLHHEPSRSIETLLDHPVQTPSGRYPLRRFVSATPVDLPVALLRNEQSPIRQIQIDLASGTALQDGLAALQHHLKDIPRTISVDIEGSNQAFREALTALGWSMILSIVLVYLLLAAQFENLKQPLIILAAVPLSISGVAFTLWITGHSINLMSMTGCVVLIGIIVNDAIVKVDFINQRRRAGVGVREAIEAAGQARLRPILMTSITTILGMVPVAIGLGSGAALRAPLAVAIIGGLAGGTLLTLFVIPALYYLIARPKA